MVEYDEYLKSAFSYFQTNPIEKPSESVEEERLVFLEKFSVAEALETCAQKSGISH